MSTTTVHDGSPRTAEFDIDLASHGRDGPDVPTLVHVEVNADASETFVAIVDAAEHGRWSFDVRIERGGVEIARAYEEGMRVDVDELPSWMTLVRREIEGLVSGER